MKLSPSSPGGFLALTVLALIVAEPVASPLGTAATRLVSHLKGDPIFWVAVGAMVVVAAFITDAVRTRRRARAAEHALLELKRELEL